MKKHWQKNKTITKAQEKFIKANKGKMNNVELAKMLGLPYNKLHNNLRLMGLVKTKITPVVQMNGYFDEQAFFKHYEY
jgi:hypothetical protein